MELVLESEWSQFQSWDEPDGYLYHASILPNITQILQTRCLRGGHAGFMGRAEPTTHSTGHVFLTERAGVSFWAETAENHAFDKYDDPPPIAVIRIRRETVASRLEPDPAGTRDARVASYRVKGQIQEHFQEPYMSFKTFIVEASTTFRRDRLKRLAQAGKLYMKGSYHFDDMYGQSGFKSKGPDDLKPVVYSDKGYHVPHAEGSVVLTDFDFSTKSGGCWKNDDGSIHLTVHGNCNYDFVIKESFGHDDEVPGGFQDADFEQRDFENAAHNYNRSLKLAKKAFKAGDKVKAANLCPHGAGYPTNSLAAEHENDPRKGQKGRRCSNCGSFFKGLGDSPTDYMKMCGMTPTVPCEFPPKSLTEAADPYANPKTGSSLDGSFPHEQVRQKLNYLRSRGFDRSSYVANSKPPRYTVGCARCRVDGDQHADGCPNDRIEESVMTESTPVLTLVDRRGKTVWTASQREDGFTYSGEGCVGNVASKTDIFSSATVTWCDRPSYKASGPWAQELVDWILQNRAKWPASAAPNSLRTVSEQTITERKDVMGRELTMTLTQWEKKYNRHVTTHKGGAKLIYDTPPVVHAEAWDMHHLSDYLVSALSGGTWWLVPREIEESVTPFKTFLTEGVKPDIKYQFKDGSGGVLVHLKSLSSHTALSRFNMECQDEPFNVGYIPTVLMCGSGVHGVRVHRVLGNIIVVDARVGRGPVKYDVWKVNGPIKTNEDDAYNHEFTMRAVKDNSPVRRSYPLSPGD